MERKNSYYLIAIIALAVAVVSLSVAFAFTDIDLTIDGNVTTKATKWDVHFKEIKNVNKPNTVTVTSAAALASGDAPLTASYTVTLTKPGDFYEFDIDVINAGDFDAKLKTIALTSTSGIAYLNHVVTYNSTDYTAASNNVNGNTLAAGGGTETVHVKIEYVQPASENDLPKTDQTGTYTVTLTYTQANVATSGN